MGRDVVISMRQGSGMVCEDKCGVVAGKMNTSSERDVWDYYSICNDEYLSRIIIV